MQGTVDGQASDSYYLVLNEQAVTLQLRATFMRDDGLVVTRDYSVAPSRRFTIWAGWVPELVGRKFAVQLEATNAVPFVAERAVYWGAGWFGGHGSVGAPWSVQ